jgi:hypothetical protein
MGSERGREGTATAPSAQASCSSTRRAAAHGLDAPSLSLSHRPDAAVPLGPRAHTHTYTLGPDAAVPLVQHARGTRCYGAAGG